MPSVRSLDARHALASVAALVLLAAPAAAQQIDTYTGQTLNPAARVVLGEDQLSGNYYPGELRQLRMVGQTFVAQAGQTQLDAFTFLVGPTHPSNAIMNPGSVHARAYVMAFDDATGIPTGPVLWHSSAPRDGQATYDFNAPVVPWDFATGGLTLTAGQRYVAFLSTLMEPANIRDRWGDLDASAFGVAYNYVATVGGSAYADGRLWRMDARALAFTDPDDYWAFWTDAALRQTRNYLLYGSSADDAAFSATFTAGGAVGPVTTAPEPATWALLGAGIAALGAVARCRRGTPTA
ncbi:MAG: PEP-CTERM sorting domain-containing protein [Gemmatirosa sp.]